jgi:hypothetical protein
MKTSFFINLFLLCCTRGILGHLQKFLQNTMVEFTTSFILLYLSFPHSWSSFNRFHFSIYINEFIIFSPYSPSLYPPSSTCTYPPDWTCFAFLFSVFVKKEKNDIFCLFKIAIQSISLWHFYVYMYYSAEWSSPLFFSIREPSFLVVISTGLKILYSFFYRKYISHIHLLKNEDF